MSEERGRLAEENALNNIMTDEQQNFLIYQIRLKMSMKRNILKKSMSEDLTWADFLKNDINHAMPSMAFMT